MSIENTRSDSIQAVHAYIKSLEPGSSSGKQILVIEGEGIQKHVVCKPYEKTGYIDRFAAIFGYGPCSFKEIVKTLAEQHIDTTSLGDAGQQFIKKVTTYNSTRTFGFKAVAISTVKELQQSSYKTIADNKAITPEMITQCLEIIKKDPNDRHAIAHLANNYDLLDGSKQKEFMEIFQKIDYDPADAFRHLVVGQIFMKIDDLPRSAGSLEQARLCDPTNTHIKNICKNLSDTILQAPDKVLLTDTRTALSIALSMNPENHEIYLRLADEQVCHFDREELETVIPYVNTLTNEGKYSQAEKLVQKILDSVYLMAKRGETFENESQGVQECLDLLVEKGAVTSVTSVFEKFLKVIDPWQSTKNTALVALVLSNIANIENKADVKALFKETVDVARKTIPYKNAEELLKPYIANHPEFAPPLSAVIEGETGDGYPRERLNNLKKLLLARPEITANATTVKLLQNIAYSSDGAVCKEATALLCECLPKLDKKDLSNRLFFDLAETVRVFHGSDDEQAVALMRVIHTTFPDLIQAFTDVCSKNQDILIIGKELGKLISADVKPIEVREVFKVLEGLSALHKLVSADSSPFDKVRDHIKEFEKIMNNHWHELSMPDLERLVELAPSIANTDGFVRFFLATMNSSSHQITDKDIASLKQYIEALPKEELSPEIFFEVSKCAAKAHQSGSAKQAKALVAIIDKSFAGTIEQISQLLLDKGKSSLEIEQGLWNIMPFMSGGNLLRATIDSLILMCQLLGKKKLATQYEQRRKDLL